MPHFTIHSQATQGDGIAEYDGKPLYVPEAVKGDELEVEIVSENKKQAVGRIVRIIKPGEGRAEPVCRHYHECGGCAFQHLSDAAYYAVKQQQLIHAVTWAGYDPAVVKPCVQVGQHSRRRVQLKYEGGKLGFYAKASHAVVALEECPVMEKALWEVVAELSSLVLGENGEREISLSLLDHGVDMLLSAKQPPTEEERASLLAFAENADLLRVNWQVGEELLPIVSRRLASIRLGETDITVPPDTFLQASKAGESAMVEAVLAACKGRKRVADLYAGCGTYAFSLLAAGHKVEAFEGSGAMVDAMQSAGGVKATKRDLFKNPLTPQELTKFDAIVMNPPRNGAETQSHQLAASYVKKIVMVSCNPTTFSRDAAILRQGGYRLLSAVAIDQFYWSNHLEVVGVFGR
jgi:23S rRNA (uracil1939-C5)-methyltransferase